MSSITCSRSSSYLVVEPRFRSMSIILQSKYPLFIGPHQFSLGQNPDLTPKQKKKGGGGIPYIQRPVLSICSSCAPLQRAAVRVEGGRPLQRQGMSHRTHLEGPHGEVRFKSFHSSKPRLCIISFKILSTYKNTHPL